MTMMPRKTVDVAHNKRTMIIAGGEDTALLRSNRSAHAGAETQAGGCQGDRPLSLLTPTAFSPLSDKPRGLGQSPKAALRRGGTYVRMRELCVMIPRRCPMVSTQLRTTRRTTLGGGSDNRGQAASQVR